MEESEIVQEGIALLEGYDCGLIWEYKNPYPEHLTLWSLYIYGYILGVINVMPEDA